MVDYNAMKEISGFKSQGNYVSKKKVKELIENKDLSA